MGDQPERIENLVARRIREQLGQGGLDKLIQAQQAVAQQIELIGVPSPRAFGDMIVVTQGMAAQLQPTEASLSGQAAVAAIRAVDRELADELELRSPQDITAALNFRAALINLIAAFVSLYQMMHGVPPSQQHIEQTINNVTNAPTTIVINNPPQGGE
ncbi:hypothetical protein KXD96_22800 [Mycobacterium sp. SMC-2]|uniref:hypothetical protein n=1 Tax=Mycobacterium sp. SMC-2 TaxID=2857058 RepID=UPI0021B4C11D|nr:hypothetical protein [Mycobacterium sp. SMC-2]UXA05706.1 hypothetical protein KXD96_22800 [Mycobacterium sp. SMC-2]